MMDIHPPVTDFEIEYMNEIHCLFDNYLIRLQIVSSIFHYIIYVFYYIGYERNCVQISQQL